MDLTSSRVIKELLEKRKVIVSKGLGQRFLIDSEALKTVIETADLKAEDVVLEIGPGIGTLTQELAKRAKRVIAIEKDEKMTGILKETLKDFQNVEIITGDVLKIPNTKYQILNTKYKVVANLPYYITSPVIRQFLEQNVEVRLQQPELMVLMVQKEVAQRICAKPPDMSLLAVSVQFYAQPEIISYVSKESFWPKPKVDSAILRITPHKLLRPNLNSELFFNIVRTGFSHPRKQLINNLSTGFDTPRQTISKWLMANGIEPTQRAETLSVEDWLNLTKSFKLSQ